jgi:methylenetetrahydrofolate dehydrogenase (NADP+)/methenyltetrahydrofolate cyclohydrolase
LASLADIRPIDLSGKKAIVIGRSILVGKPAATLLLERNATVTVAHSKTADIASACREADIVVAAVGIPEFVKGSWIKEGAVVIDVGINRLDTGKLAGDVQYQEAAAKASAITPVPGGVGPMTVAMLMRNIGILLSAISYQQSAIGNQPMAASEYGTRYQLKLS